MSAEKDNKKAKKIIQIKNGEYLLDVNGKSIVTTYKRKCAMDVTEWSLNTLSYILSSLASVGYGDVRVMDDEIEIEKEVK